MNTMKKLLLLVTLLMSISFATNAQSQKSVRSEVRPTGETKAENYAEIKFDTLRINLGIFPEADQHWYSSTDHQPSFRLLRMHGAHLHKRPHQTRREGQHQCKLQRQGTDDRPFLQDYYRTLQREEQNSTPDNRGRDDKVKVSPSF